MDKAPQPTGSRIQELGDQLIVHFRPRRSWGTLAFLAFWLTFWTAGGIAAFTQLFHGDLGARLFILLWLCFWTFGEATVAIIIAWQLFGHELLLVSPERLELRKQIGPATTQGLLPRVRVRRQACACRRGDEPAGGRAHRGDHLSADPSADVVGRREPCRAARDSTRKRASHSCGAEAPQPAADRVSTHCAGGALKRRRVGPA